MTPSPADVAPQDRLADGWPILRVYQVCIQYDAQRREHGYRLVRRLIEKASKEGYEAISCYVADDIEANAFWTAAGFVLRGQRDVGNRRNRKHNHYVMVMPNPWQSVITLEYAPAYDGKEKVNVL